MTETQKKAESWKIGMMGLEKKKIFLIFYYFIIPSFLDLIRGSLCQT